MTPDETAALAKLGGRAAAGVAWHVQQLHQTISRRVFDSAGDSAVPARQVHDAVAEPVYSAVRTGLLGAGELTALVLRLSGTGGSSRLGDRPASNTAISALNAVVGHDLAERGDPLAISMAVRVGGRDVPAEAAAMAGAFPGATPRLAVFIHGLGEHEGAWGVGAADGGPTYGMRLSDDLGFSPVYVRYNTGRHVSTSGKELSILLDAVVAEWPVRVERIVIIGHSMGGLVARAACADRDNRWTSLVSDVIYLGSPHGGTFLARAGRWAARALEKLPETQAYAPLLDVSPGIRDLRFGYVADDDWAECDAGTCLDDHGTDVPLLATANHYAVSATVVDDPATLAGRVVGDLLVQPASAQGQTSRSRLPFLDRLNVPGRHHFHLLNDPEIYTAMHDWLAPRGPGAPRVPQA
jgi:pimeloyl-ACP methyl ester carboxylesterase